MPAGWGEADSPVEAVHLCLLAEALLDAHGDGSFLRGGVRRLQVALVPAQGLEPWCLPVGLFWSLTPGASARSP